MQPAGTLMLSSLANLAGCQAMGVRLCQRKRDPVFHLWHYVGLLMGVHSEPIPVTQDRRAARRFATGA
jgi:hypothetical protein